MACFFECDNCGKRDPAGEVCWGGYLKPSEWRQVNAETVQDACGQGVPRPFAQSPRRLGM